MGDVIEVDGLTEAQLLEIALSESMDMLGDEPQPIQPGEYTVQVWMEEYRERYGVSISENTARRKLAGLMRRGLVARAERKNPETGHKCMAYRNVEGGG